MVISRFLASGRHVDWLLFLLMSTIWGSSFYFVNRCLPGIGPAALVAARMAIAAVALVVIDRVRGSRMHYSFSVYLRLGLMAALNITVPYTMVTWAQESVDVSVAAVLISTTPLFVYVITVCCLRIERLTLQKALSLAVGFAGVVFLVGGAGTHGSTAGEVVVVAAAAIFAIANVCSYKLVQGVDPLRVALAQSVFAVLWEIPLIAVLHERPLHLNGGELFDLLWLGLLNSAVVYVIYFYILGKWGSTRTSMGAYLQPLVGAALGFLLLGERLSSWSALGMCLIVLGVIGFAASRSGQSSTPELHGSPPAEPRERMAP